MFLNNSFNLSDNSVSISNFVNELKNYLDNFAGKDFNITDLYTIDRFEDNDIAVCENRVTGKFVNIPKNLIEETARSGDIIKYENGIYATQKEKTSLAKSQIKFKRNKINFSKDS